MARATLFPGKALTIEIDGGSRIPFTANANIAARFVARAASTHAVASRCDCGKGRRAIFSASIHGRPNACKTMAAVLSANFSCLDRNTFLVRTVRVEDAEG
jgi:hypothetical protein